METTMPAGAESPAATFAISVEPLGGSKTGGPTGPVVYTGQLVKE
jgi:anti-sigma-K factor RskA